MINRVAKLGGEVVQLCVWAVAGLGARHTREYDMGIQYDCKTSCMAVWLDVGGS